MTSELVASELVSLDDISRAADRIRGVAVRTPLLPLDGHADVFLKAENLQPIGAFKIRGAYNAIAALPPERRARGVVSHSSGNHARGVARAARLLGTRAVIVMPRGAPVTKVRGVQADGADIVWVGPASDERAQRAAEIAERDALALIPSYDDREIIAGQGTIGLEIVEQARRLRGADGPPLTVLVPIGGAGLISGIAVAMKSLAPGTTVVGVEPELAADAKESLESGRLMRWDPQRVGRTSADGMRTTSLSPLTFAHVARHVDAIVTVSETEIFRAMSRAAAVARLVVEPSGATALAALLFHGDELGERGPVVVVISGGNVDPGPYREMLAQGEAAGG